MRSSDLGKKNMNICKADIVRHEADSIISGLVIKKRSRLNNSLTLGKKKPT